MAKKKRRISQATLARAILGGYLYYERVKEMDLPIVRKGGRAYLSIGVAVPMDTIARARRDKAKGVNGWSKP